jgi:biopolymer transport protein ExbB
MSFSKRLTALLVAAVVFCAPVVTSVIAMQPGNASAQAPATDAAKPADTPAAAPAAPAAGGKVEIENPYGLKALLLSPGNYVDKGTLAILLIMSMGSWYILIVKLFEQSRIMKDSKEAAASFWNSGSLKSGTESLKENSAFRFIAESGLKATDHHGGLLGEVDLNTWVTMSIQRAQENVNNRLGDGLAFLATVGSTAPFIGLFGTVWGIYNALTAIGIAGQMSIDKVAGPVGAALIMTAVGLAVAVPAVLSYNWLIRRNKNAMEQVRGFSADLHSVLMSKGAKAK